MHTLGLICSLVHLDCAGQAHHEGGFALWPSKHTPYSVAASSWKGGKGDVLREFADAANKWGIRIGYYLNVQDDGYMNSVANYTCDDFIKRQVGMVTEVLTDYGKSLSSASPFYVYSLSGFLKRCSCFAASVEQAPSIASGLTARHPTRARRPHSYGIKYTKPSAPSHHGQ